MRKMRRLSPYLLVFCSFISACSRSAPGNLPDNSTYPDIFPDYREVTIPPGVAPLNFRMSANCDRMYILVSGKEFNFGLKSSGNKAVFPVKKWKHLLDASSGDSLTIGIFTEAGGKWTGYKPFNIYVAREPADDYLVYRLLMPGFQNWNRMGIYQRSLSDFKERTILDSRVMPGTCMNCHSFAKNNPDNMVLHLRESYGGTILFRDHNLKKINTKTDRMFANAAFPSWHPSGRFIAFSVNRVNQIFHAVGISRAAAVDMKSDIFVYDIANNKMLSSPAISDDENLETFPCFSSDGSALYYCSAAGVKLPEKFDSIMYSLCRIKFDPATGVFGEKADTLISTHTLGKSISIPRVSPDNKFIMFNVTDYGAFPSYNPEADLRMIDLETKKINPLEKINSSSAESWHSWSSNGRWVAFSSRRMDGLYSNVYIAYIDEKGNPGKPFLLPQKDPDFHDDFLSSFNVPEFTIKPIGVNPHQIEKAAKGTLFTQVQSGSSH